jgi:hypothetical protein
MIWQSAQTSGPKDWTGNPDYDIVIIVQKRWPIALKGTE